MLVEVSSGYEQAGNLHAVTAVKSGWGDKQKARVNYVKAVAVLSSAPGIDPQLLQARTEQIGRRMSSIGARLDAVPSVAVPDQPVAEAAPAMPRSASPAASPAESAPVSEPPPPPPPQVAPPASQASAPSAEMTELAERLDVAVTQAARARKNLDTLRQSLAARGQSVHPDTLTAMAQVESYLQQARSYVGRGDLATAKENLLQAEYTLKQVFRAVGN